MHRGAFLRSSDVRSLLRLIRECADKSAKNEDHAAHFLAGMADLVDAQAGMLAEIEHFGDRTRMSVLRTRLLGLEGEEHRGLLRQVEGDLWANPATEPFMAMSGPVVSGARADLIDDGAWYASEYVQTVKRGLGIDDFIFSRIELAPGGRVSSLSLHRSWGGQAFGRYHVQLLSLAHAEYACVAPRPSGEQNSGAEAPGDEVHREGWLVEAPRVRAGAHLCASVDRERLAAAQALLTPRQAEILPLLLEPETETEIARRLFRSRDTVHSHVQRIYQVLGVKSRLELVKLLSGEDPRPIGMSSPTPEALGLDFGTDVPATPS
jgi:DNA-binding CsgD family transcriptional regulator